MQNYKEGEHSLYFYAFDLLHLNGDCLHGLPLTTRKERLPKLLEGAAPCFRLSASLEGKPEAMVSFCREHRLEGIVAKKRDSVYRPGDRCASWVKFKTQQEGTFIVGGFLPSIDGFSSIAVGFKRGGEFRYAGKLEVYLPKSAKAEALKRLVPLASSAPHFAHIPQKRTGDTWSAGITAHEIERFVWMKPSIKAAVQFQEWTRAGYLRHAKLREFHIPQSAPRIAVAGRGLIPEDIVLNNCFGNEIPLVSYIGSTLCELPLCAGLSFEQSAGAV